MGTAILLFSHDLRLDDNAALALASQYESLLCVYCVDPAAFSPGRYQLAAMGVHRWQFIQQSLDDLASRLTNLGQRLHVYYGKPLSVLGQLVQASDASALICSRQFGYYEQQYLQQLNLQFSDLSVHQVDSFSLFEAAHGSWLNRDLATQFTPFRKQAEQQLVQPAQSAIRHLPPPPKLAAKSSLVLADASLPDELRNKHSAKSPFKGGETAAQDHLNAYFASQAPSHYKATRNALSGWQNSSKFSPWLNQGVLSLRRLWASIDEYEAKHGANESTYWLKFELLWREFFLWQAQQQGHHLFSLHSKKKRLHHRSFAPQRFKAWCEGNTPSRLVNACMQELKQTGYLSNRGRQIAASYLVNELEHDWRYGAAWFEQQLIDYNVAINWGNWRYIAGVGADPRGGRHFNIAKQAELYDPDSHYQDYWCDYPCPTQIDYVDASDWPIMDAQG